MKKNFFIYLNETSTSHLFLLNESFLKFLNTRGNIILISHNTIKEFNKINFLKNYKKIFIRKKKLDFFFTKSSINKILKQFRLHTCYNHKKNITIKNFNKLFINSRFKNNLIGSYGWKIIQFFFSRLTFLRYILYFIQRLNLPREVKNIFKNSKNSTLILSSPGWWNYDQFFFSEAKKSKLNVWSFIMNWDQASAMGLASDKADHYFAWSENMKKDLINFNNINANRITVTGPMIYNNYYKIAKKITSKYKKKRKNKQILIALRSPTRQRENEVELFLDKILKMKFSFNVIFVVKFHPIHFSKRFYQNALTILEKYKNSKKIQFYNSDELKKVKKYKHLNDKDGDIIKKIKNLNKDFNRKVELYKNTDLIINFFSTINLEAAFFKIPSINFLKKNIKFKSSSTDKKEVDLGVNTFHIQRSIINKSLTLVLGYKNLENKINFLINNINVNQKILKNEINNLNEHPIKNIMKQIDKLI